MLGHAGLTAGIILLSPVKNGNRRINILNPKIKFDEFLWKFSVATFVGGILFRFVPGFQQFGGGLTSISIFSGTFLLVKGINAMKRNEEAKVITPNAPVISNEEILLAEIRDLLKK